MDKKNFSVITEYWNDKGGKIILFLELKALGN